MSLNKMILMGRLGKDVEMRYTQSGSAVGRILLATTDRFKNANQEYEEQTDWHNIVVFGKLAEVCSNYIKKGSTVWLEGKSKTRSWEDDSGNKKYRHEIVASNIIFLDKPKPQDNSNTIANEDKAQDDSFTRSDLDIPF